MDFPKRYDPKDAEPRLREFWRESGIYRFDPDDPRPVFSVDTPPPYVSHAHLHIGHAMSYSQAEFIVRYKRMKGHSVFYPMGFDDNGLPTERYVEQKYKIDKGKISREEFVRLCLQETRAGAEAYRELWESLAISVDWDLTYSTIDPRSRRTAQLSFLDLHDKGLVERREEPITWCYTCGTSLAQADIDTEERETRLNDIAFTGPDGERLVISTTRPELIPACVALYAHPDDERYRSLFGRTARVPLFDHEVEIRTHESVDPAFGTGLMMVCTWGDVEDVKKWKEHRLPTRNVFGAWGKLNELAGAYAGQKASVARENILKDLAAGGFLLGQKPLAQFVGVHDRCATPVEFAISPQWFISVLPGREEYLRRGDELAWHPEHFHVRYRDWVEGLKWDWCISRQRFYGVPFPVWYCEKCGAPRFATPGELPVDPTAVAPPAQTTCAACGSGGFRPEPDVMDTWMTSSLTPLINARWAYDDNLMDRIYPMSIRVQAFEIIRTWLFYTVAKSHHHTHSLPWRDVMISGWGLDEKGKKMSKRAGNVVDPKTVIDKYGADAVRYWSAGATLGNDLRYNERDVANGKKLLTKLWNATKFVAAHLFDESGARRELVAGTPTAIDRWIQSRLQQVIADATRDLDQYEYSHALGTAERFFFGEFCDNYIEIVKERFWNPDAFEPGVVEAARSTLAEVNRAVLHLFAPFIPYITEELYQLVYRGDGGPVSIHVSPWPVADEARVDPAAIEAGNLMLAVLTGARRWKTAQQVNPNYPLARLAIDAPPELAEKLAPLAADLRAAAHADTLEFVPEGDVATDDARIRLSLTLGEKRLREDEPSL
ncbi:valine--tRNA ligase [bacterium]|nr:valine--tRNA ligase [bacterium]